MACLGQTRSQSPVYSQAAGQATIAVDPFIASAPVGQALTRSPQPVQQAGSMIGTGCTPSAPGCEPAILALIKNKTLE
jgi:hypothetical protein